MLCVCGRVRLFAYLKIVLGFVSIIHGIISHGCPSRTCPQEALKLEGKLFLMRRICTVCFRKDGLLFLNPHGHRESVSLSHTHTKNTHTPRAMHQMRCRGSLCLTLCTPIAKFIGKKATGHSVSFSFCVFYDDSVFHSLSTISRSTLRRLIWLPVIALRIIALHSIAFRFVSS